MNSLFLLQKYLKKSFPVNILGYFLTPIGAVRDLGVWFDSNFTFLRHVQNISEVIWHACCSFGCKYFVGTRPDYCNSLFRSLSALDLPKIWNDLPDDVHSATSLHFSPLIQKDAQNLSFCTSVSTLISAFPSFSLWH